mmetsp:Transcript_7551/g.19565  ORF Transcript_7551/g.19565 Transcript_7551/m.19565 type:complete len:209 (+) Transcript_7551:429-1055(+)
MRQPEGTQLLAHWVCKDATLEAVEGKRPHLTVVRTRVDLKFGRRHSANNCSTASRDKGEIPLYPERCAVPARAVARVKVLYDALRFEKRSVAALVDQIRNRAPARARKHFIAKIVGLATALPACSGAGADLESEVEHGTGIPHFGAKRRAVELVENQPSSGSLQLPAQRGRIVEEVERAEAKRVATWGRRPPRDPWPPASDKDSCTEA